MMAVPAAGRRLGRARAAVAAYFVLLGTAFSTWSARIPAIKHELHLSNRALGLALFAIPCGSVATFPLTGRLSDRFHGGVVLRVAGPLTALTLIGPSLAGDLAWLVVTLFGFGAAAGFLDVAMNAAGARLELRYGRPIMSSLHASYSLAGLFGAGLGGLFAFAGIGPFATFLAASVPLATVGWVASRWVIAGEPAAPGAPRALEPTAAGESAAAGEPARAGEPAGTPLGTKATLLIWAFGLMALCGQVGEGSAGDWSAVYLHDNLGTSAGFAATGLIAFSIAMTAGRLAGDALAARFGAVRLVRWSGLVAAGGLGGGLLAANPVSGVLAFALLGAGLAAIFPQLVAAAGRLDPARAGRNFARIAGIGYTGLLGGPVVIGFAAGEVGLSAALLIPAGLALVVAVFAGTLRTGAAPEPLRTPTRLPRPR